VDVTTGYDEACSQWRQELGGKCWTEEAEREVLVWR